MGSFRADEFENYGSNGGGGFFKLTADKEVKQVRFMYETIDDIEGMAVHKIKLDGKDRYVNCLRDYNESVDACPFCREGYKTEAKLFIPVYNIDEDCAQIWDRGKTMFQKLISQCKRYSNEKTHICNNIFEIERQGKPKDTNTTYEIFQVDRDDTELADLPEAKKVLGGLVLDKSADDMEFYLENKEFPPEGDAEESDTPVRRRESRTASRSSERRTPARTRRSEDEF